MTGRLTGRLERLADGRTDRRGQHNEARPHRRTRHIMETPNIGLEGVCGQSPVGSRLYTESGSRHAIPVSTAYGWTSTGSPRHPTVGVDICMLAETPAPTVRRWQRHQQSDTGRDSNSQTLTVRHRQTGPARWASLGAKPMLASPAWTFIWHLLSAAAAAAATHSTAGIPVFYCRYTSLFRAHDASINPHIPHYVAGCAFNTAVRCGGGADTSCSASVLGEVPPIPCFTASMDKPRCLHGPSLAGPGRTKDMPMQIQAKRNE